MHFSAENKNETSPPQEVGAVTAICGIAASAGAT